MSARSDLILSSTGSSCLLLSKARSFPSLKELFRQFAERAGAPFFMYVMRTGRAVQPPQMVTLSNFPSTYKAWYREHKANEFDHVLERAEHGDGCFRWDGLAMTDQQRALAKAAADCGIRYGISAVNRGADGCMTMFAVTGPSPLCVERSEWEAIASSLQLVNFASQPAVVETVLIKLGQARDLVQAFTPAERRALECMAAGMTAEEAAKLMNTRRRSIYYYLDSAARKLAVPKRKEAVMKAISLGLINVRPMEPFAIGNLRVSEE